MITQIVKLDSIDSPQTLAKQMALAGAQSGTIIFAETQTHGRGQFSREWNSQKGGLYFSLILRPVKEIQFSPSLSLKAAAVVADTLKKEFGVKTKIKHPNDILAWHPRRKKWLKACGILIESSSYDSSAEWFVIGVGVNLNNKLDKALTEAASIAAIINKQIDAEAFTSVLLKNFSLRYHDWLNSSVF